MKKTNNNQYIFFVLSILFVLLLLFGLRLGTLYEMNGQRLSIMMLSQASDEIFSLKPIKISADSLPIVLFPSVIGLLVWVNFYTQQRKNRQNEAFGSSKWNNPNYTKELREEDNSKNWIFTSTEIVSMDMKKTHRNRNCTIIGRPGLGKSRYWLIPNILNAGNETLIITDPKEELLKATGYSLKSKGYDIRVLNLRTKWRSDHYNPLQYIRKLPKEAFLLDLNSDISREESVSSLLNDAKNIAEDDVMSLINTIMENTKSATIESNTGDPFWEKAEMMFLQAIFYYVIFNYPIEKRNFRNILALIREGNPDNEGNCELFNRFEEWEKRDPDNIGIKQWKHFIVSARSPKMMSTIVMTASARLAPFNLREIDELTYQDTLQLDRIGKPMNSPLDENGNRTNGKIAYFIVTNPNDTAFNFLANLLYSQIFNMIDQNASENDGRLSLPCNMYMDEFKQLGKIPHFLENWAYVRGLNCGITVILQSLSQFKEMYKDGWETGLDCCDYILFLGSRSKETLEYMVSVLGKQTLYKKSTSRSFSRQNSTSTSWDVYGRELVTIEELAQMEAGHGILMMSGTDPFYSKLYDLEKDPNYHMLWEPWVEQSGKDNPEVRNSERWKQNHQKYYDHLVERRKDKVRNNYHTISILEKYGINCQVQAPLEMLQNMTSEEIYKLYGNDGWENVSAKQIKKG